MLEPEVLALGVAHTAIPGVFLIGRLMSAAFSVAGVFLLFVAARRLTGDAWAALAAALFLAVSPAHVEQGHYITPDSHLIFFGLLALIASTSILRRGATRDYLLAGAAIGLAAGSKYNGPAFLLIPATAHFLRLGRTGWRDPRLWTHTFGAALAAFLIVNPYAVLSAREFADALLSETRHYAVEGHEGMEGGAPIWYLRYFALFEGPVLLLAAWRIIRRRNEPATALAAVFPMIYIVAICMIPVRNARTALPALPFLFLLAGWTTASLGRAIAQAPGPRIRRIAAVCALVGGLAALPLARSISFDVNLVNGDGRLAAARWIARNLPPNSGISVEGYGPFVSPYIYQVYPVHTIADYPPSHFRQKGIRFLVMGETMIARFRAYPEENAERLKRYAALETEYMELGRFNQGGYEVRVYDLKWPLSPPDEPAGQAR